MSQVKHPLVVAIETIALQKSLSEELLFSAMEDALTSVANKSAPAELGFGHNEIRASINRKTGELELRMFWEVVDDQHEDLKPHHIPLKQAQEKYGEVSVGDEIEELLDHPGLSRIDYHQTRQMLMRIVREADRNKIAEQYLKRIHTLFTGKVKRVTREHLLVEIDENVDGMLSRKDMLERDIFRVGDRIKSLLVEVASDRTPMLKLSRTAPQFIIELFKQEVPECSEGSVHIKAAAREPGVRAKIAVKSNDVRIDPVGACIGMRGSRIQTVTNELNGERIDVILWDDDVAQLTINALAPAQIRSLALNERDRSMDIAVDPEQLASVIGRGGQNIRLASQLVGWQLNVMTQAQAESRFKTRSLLLSVLFKEALDVDDDVAGVLMREGYTSLDEIIAASVHELSSIPEFDEDIAHALIDRAKQAMVRHAITGAPVEVSDLHELEDMTPEIAQQCLEKNIYAQEDLAELAVDELCELIGIDEALAAKLILAARQTWFEG